MGDLWRPKGSLSRLLQDVQPCQQAVPRGESGRGVKMGVKMGVKCDIRLEEDWVHVSRSGALLGDVSVSLGKHVRERVRGNVYGGRYWRWVPSLVSLSPSNLSHPTYPHPTYPHPTYLIQPIPIQPARPPHYVKYEVWGLKHASSLMNACFLLLQQDTLTVCMQSHIILYIA